MKYSRAAFVCIFALILSVTSQAVAGEGHYDTGGVGLRDGEADCNGNGVPDAMEIGPLPGHALLFDGSGDYVDPGASSALADLGQGDFTIEAWINTDDPGHSILMGNMGGASRLYNLVIRGNEEGGVIRLRIEDGATSYACTGTVSVNDGSWHHVAASRWRGEGGAIGLYVDGEDAGKCLCDNQGTGPFTADNQTLIGSDQTVDPNYFSGAMDELRVWNVGLSVDDVRTNMYRVVDGDEAGLVAYWRFDEGAGSVAQDSAGSHDGTLVGSPAWAQSLDNCNTNTVPDECEVGGTEDCNMNSIPDLCDIYNGDSEDCNGNGVPDECETLPSGVIYVDDDATSGSNDGSSWANAHTDLQAALAHAKCSGRVDEIRVAGGTHKPGTSREDSFHMLNGVALRGGYRGLEGSGDPNERNTNTFTTTLSGDINGDDQWEWENRSDNSNHVVVGSNTDSSAVLDGFTIRSGYADEDGGGLYCHRGRLKVIDCTFMFNWATLNGGGVATQNGGPTLTGCTFSGNEAGDYGGGLDNTGSDPTLTDCLFIGNKAVIGGGIANYGSSPTLSNCVFIGNAAEGEVKGGGAIRNFYQSSPTLVGCIFSGNSGYRGGAIYNEWLCAPTIINCTFIGNAAVEVGGGLYCHSYEPASSIVVNSIFWDNSAAGAPQIAHGGDVLTIATYSCIQGGYEGVGNISVDPMFIDADGGDDVFGTFDDNWHLLEASPCINAGDDGEVPAGVTHDFDGDDRIQQCRVDMGADESSYLGDDCNSNGVADECDIENCDGSAWCGDCNGNGVPDECDIASGASADENGNGVPDECEIFGDCDHDLDVDLDDYGEMLSCMLGPDVDSGGDCDCFDGDGDSDVDLKDFALFQQAFTGPQE